MVSKGWFHTNNALSDLSDMIHFNTFHTSQKAFVTEPLSATKQFKNRILHELRQWKRQESMHAMQALIFNKIPIARFTTEIHPKMRVGGIFPPPGSHSEGKLPLF